MSHPVLRALACLPDLPLAVGFSGGMDSSVLLHALAGLRRGQVQAVHVDHGLDPQSTRWAAHCQSQAASWGVPCQILRVQVDPRHPGGLEAAARQARYQAIAEVLGPDAVLVLAHHLEDQAETVLLRLLRRAGPRGLAAMRRRAAAPGGLQLWRPLLGLSRTELADYAAQQQIAHLDDPMNADCRFDRVWLRRQVLPLLGQRWPDASLALADSAALLADEDDAREVDGRQALAACRGLDPHTLLLAPLAAQAPTLRRPLLERWLRQLGAPEMPAELLQRLASGLPSLPERGFASLRWGGWLVERYRDELRAGPEANCEFDERDWDGRAALDLPGGSLQLLGARQLPWTAKIRLRLGGERLQLPGRQHQHALKDQLQALGIPPWERRGLPLLFAPDGQLAAAGDLLYSATFDHWLREAGARLRWNPVQPMA